MAKHSKHKRPMPARNDMQPWEGYESKEVKPGMHTMPDGSMMSDKEMMMEKPARKKKRGKK